MNKIKFAFHVHTYYSKDSWSKPKDIIGYCRKNGIGAIAICDHNQIGGALECQKIAQGNPVVIIGEEIKTTEGEIIGLFLSKRIEKGLTVEKSIEEIRKQNGLVCIPHPGETFRRSAISKQKIEQFIDQVDLIEVFNSRTLLKKDLLWAYDLASKNNLAMIAGSDAHTIGKIISAINTINIFTNRQEFSKETLSLNIDKTERSGILDQVITKIYKNLNIRR